MAAKDKTYVSWVGLRGAVPIIFAIIPLTENIKDSETIFNIVFFCTLISLLVQGTSLPAVARWLGLAEKSNEVAKLKDFDIDISSDIKTILTEIELTPESLAKNNKLMHLGLPDKTLVVMVKRNDKYFVPSGRTVLEPSDKLLIMADDRDALEDTYEKLGINLNTL